MKQKKNKGISLIVLIITVVIIIILATTIIVNLVNGNIIGNANEAVFINDVKSLKIELEIYVSGELSNTLGNYDREKLNANESSGSYAEEEIEDRNEDGKANIYDILTSLEKSNLNRKVYIEEGNLVFKRNELTEEQIKILEKEGIKVDGVPKTKEIIYTLSENEWTNQDVTVILSFSDEIPEGYELEYRVGENSEWIKGTSVKVSENTVVRGRLYNSEIEDEMAGSSTNVSNIDKEKPTAPTVIKLEEEEKDIRLKASGSIDSLSGVAGYQYKLDENEWSETTNLEYEFTDLEGGKTYTIYARALDNTNNCSNEFSDTVFIRKNTFYVSKTGNDETGNGSIEEPFLTIDKAINIAGSGDRIKIGEGEYTLNSVSISSYTSAGIYDMEKNLEIVGENEKTILTYKGSSASTRDGCGICLKNENSIIRNLVYVFTPKSSNYEYSKAIFAFTKGSIENVFFRITGNNIASYFYGNTAGDTAKITNCTFYHNSSSVLGNYGGSPIFTNIATNVTTNGTNTNVINDGIYGYSKLTTEQLIKASKDNTNFNNSNVGVFYGKYAWDNYVDIDFTFNIDDYILNVSTTGNDETGDGTINAPYATLAKAIDASISGDRIHILKGKYTLTPMDNGAGINDKGKKLEIYGENEKTVLTYKGSTATTRDAPAFVLSNSATVVRNLTYVFNPKSSGNNYSRAIFSGGSTAKIKNVFMRIAGTNKASYLYGTSGYDIMNCTFYHNLESVDSNYGGTAKFTNIATNVNTNGTNKNVITNSFATADLSFIDIINASRDNEAFNNSSVGVFYGEYAWK